MIIKRKSILKQWRFWIAVVFILYLIFTKDKRNDYLGDNNIAISDESSSIEISK